MKIYHPYYDWECYKNGMYESGDPPDIPKVIAFLSNQPEFYSVASKMVREWCISAEEHLSAKGSNREAWVGQASVCYALGIPESITKQAWKQIPEADQIKANKTANKVILEYEKESRRLHRAMAKQVLPKDSRRGSATDTSTWESAFIQGNMFGYP